MSRTVSHRRPVWGTFVRENIAMGNGMWGFIFSHFSVVFFRCQPGTLTVYFQTQPLSLLPPLVTMLEPCISPRRPLHLATIEHSHQPLAKQSAYCNVNICPKLFYKDSQANWISMRVYGWNSYLQPANAKMHLHTCTCISMHSPTQASSSSISTTVPFLATVNASLPR